MPTDAVIFDLDGVLVDSETVVAREACAAMAEHGCALTPADYHARFHYVRLERVAAMVGEEFGLTLPEDFVPRLRARLDETFGRDLAAIAGVPEMLRALDRPRAVASGSTPEGIALKLRCTALYDLFAPHIYSVFEVARRKPAPDVFLHAAGRLGVAASACVVVEDAVPGVLAGVAAGMRVLGFTGGGHVYPALAASLAEAGADAVFDDMRELPNLL